MIQNCCTHFLKQSRNTDTDTEKVLSDETIRSMEPDAKEHAVQFSRAGLNSPLNQEDEKDVLKVISRDELARYTSGLPEQTSPDTDHEKNDNSENVYSVEKELLSLGNR